MKYRAEIDGLRAIAVVPVVFFHAGLSCFSGGFIGVDVFFVISGFLITGIIADDIKAGRFSLLRFYERRARRILPALFCVILVCWVFAFVWMRPDQLKAFATSATAAIFFFSNLYLWRDGDAYFAAASEEQVLLHTWSLSIEEQYYIVFPVFFLLLWRLGTRSVSIGIGVVAITSLALNEWAFGEAWISPAAIFYLLPTRAWELLCGAICAIDLRRSGERKSEYLSLFGLVAILASIFFYNRDTPSPSAYLLVPVAGTAAILLYGRGTGVGRVLSWRPFVGLGLISYSVYLWHQPLFAFARIRLLDEPSIAILLWLSGLSLALGWLSWRFVETPFRRSGSRSVSSHSLVMFVAVSAAFLSGLSLFTARLNGFPQRFAHYVEWSEEVFSKRPSVERDCSFGLGFIASQIDSCLGEAEDKVLLVGDSHAGTLAAALQKRVRGDGFATAVVTNHNCFPIPGLARVGYHDSLNCDQFQEKIWDFIGTRDDLTVVLFVRWSLYIEGTRFDNLEGGVERSPEGRYVVRGSIGDSNPKAATLAYVADFVLEQAERNEVVLLSQYPEAGWDIRAQVAYRPDIVVQGLTTPIEAYKQRNRRVDSMFDDLEAAGIAIVRVNEIVCDSFVVGRCTIMWGKKSFYIDDNHPSPLAATMIVERLARHLGASTAEF